MSLLAVKTTWGEIRVTAEAGRVTRCDMPQVPVRHSRAFRITSTRVTAESAPDRKVLTQAARFVRGLFAGDPGAVPPLQVPESGPFVRRAWEAMLKVRPGEIISYAELARRAGRPRAIRAAGQACATNGIPLFIPCHRVLGSGGEMGGFSCGLAWKKLLLAREHSLGCNCPRE